VGFGALAVCEYMWLKARMEGREVPPPFTWAMVLVPLVAGLALAVVLVDPRPTDPWALRSVYWALRLLVGGVALYTAYASWREDQEIPAPPVTEGSAS
jgi:hypothetical protein